MNRSTGLAVVSVAVLGFLSLVGLPHLVAGDSAAEAASRRVCKDGHFHSGESAWRPTKAQAEAEALEDWSGFTSLEYGAAWGNFNAGLGRSKSCSKSGDGLSWQCMVQAVPCVGPAARPLRTRAEARSRSKKRKSSSTAAEWSLW